MQTGLRLFLTTLGVVFLSEMGDKTQITTLLLAGAKPAYILWVGLGSAMALVCASFIEVIIGSQILARLMKPRSIELLSAVAFLILGVLLITGVMGNFQVEI
ncbi:MAG: TMEM165/GDT1 family protein [Syntrophomonadaceae bacterium]|jgi:putative Ca2+/H+ antiporter (TMEM165/GDT1 family)|nr:TMEM165/GDT1 family protein [Syntrophomonadaceae bacterium]